MKPWVKYTIIRVGLFVVLFAITYPLFLASGVLSLQYSGVAAAIISAVIALCVSYLAFGRLRAQMALELEERRRTPKVDEDAASEGDGRTQSESE